MHPYSVSLIANQCNLGTLAPYAKENKKFLYAVCKKLIGTITTRNLLHHWRDNLVIFNLHVNLSAH